MHAGPDPDFRRTTIRLGGQVVVALQLAMVGRWVAASAAEPGVALVVAMIGLVVTTVPLTLVLALTRTGAGVGTETVAAAALAAAGSSRARSPPR